MSWQQMLKTALIPWPVAKRSSLPSGLYHFQQEHDGRYVRFHLRVDPGGHAILIAGAAEAVQLPPEAALAAAHLLQGRPKDDVARELNSPGAENVVAHAGKILRELAEPRGRFPILNLPDPAVEGYVSLSAPFQADFAVGKEQSLKRIVESLWNAGIPHVRLIAGAPDSANLLVDAVTLAEDRGMIAGLRMPAHQLEEGSLLDDVAKVGLDYVVLPWGGSGEIHQRLFGADDLNCIGKTIERIRGWEMTPVLQLPLVAASFDVLEDNLEEVAAWDIGHIEVFAVATSEDPGEDNQSADGLNPVAVDELRQLAAWMEDLSNEHAAQLIWLPPQGLAAGQTVEDAARRGPRAAGDVAVRVEPKGDVIPPRGPGESAGNLLSQPFREIWQHESFRRFRGLVERPTRCDQCPGLAVCGADCPADPAGWATNE